jgi:hypothetical protein
MGTDGARLEVVGEELVYRNGDGQVGWKVEAAEILLVAEFTSTQGLGEDYFLEFGVILEGEPQFFECVTPAGADEVLEELAGRMGGSMRLKLFDEVRFRSRVVWPAELEGEPLFVVKDEARSRRAWWWFGRKPEWVVSPKLVAWMKRRWDLSVLEAGL